mmetsp:Transcript_6485/g.19120  ORF Transcript_6485/g.19120 Transcript_6485/m.19120 type:complete len:114 (+) Transcript_6485:59-400(+)
MKLVTACTIISFASFPDSTDAHGYAWQPYSRNSYAHEEGVGSSNPDSDTLPLRFYGHRGLEFGGDRFGACGARRERRFTLPSDWLTASGIPLPFQPQATYTEGEVIEIKSVIT